MGGNQYVVFNIYNTEFVVPICDVSEVINYVKITKLPGSEEGFTGVINLRGSLIPIVDISKKLCIFNERKESNHILIIETMHGKTGVIVDEVREVIELSNEDIKVVPVGLVDNRYSTGIARFNDRLLVVLNFKMLLG